MMEPNNTPFQAKDFDFIDYINNRFPNEESLDNLDHEISFLGEELDTLNVSLMEEIQEHAFLNQKL